MHYNVIKTQKLFFLN